MPQLCTLSLSLPKTIGVWEGGDSLDNSFRWCHVPFVLPSIEIFAVEVGEFVESLPLKFVLMDPWPLNDFKSAAQVHGMVFDCILIS